MKDKKPDEKNMRKWLNAYVNHLQLQEDLKRKAMVQMRQAAV